MIAIEFFDEWIDYNFYHGANDIFGKIGRLASEEVALELYDNKYERTTDQELASLLHIRAADASFSLTRWQHSVLLREKTSWPPIPPSWNFDVKSKIRLRQSMRIYVKNIHAKLHSDPIWNDRALCLLTNRPNSSEKNKMSSDMRSVSDPKSRGLSVLYTYDSKTTAWNISIYLLVN